jgi:hypothetical protein
MSELSPEAKKLMRAARESFSPDAPSVAAVFAALEKRLELGAGTGTGASAKAAAAVNGKLALSATARMVLGGLACAAVAAVGVSFEQGRRQAVAPPQMDVGPRAPDVVATTSEAETAGHSQSSARGVPGTESETRSGTREAVIRAGREQSARRAVRSGTGPARMERRDARADGNRARGGTAPEPERARASAPARATARRAASPTMPAPASTGASNSSAPRAPSAEAPAQHNRKRAPQSALARDTLAHELALLRTARAALDRGAAADALAALDLHTVRYPTGILRQERLLTRVLALCALGRQPEARASAQQLATIAPSSPHLARLRTSCAPPQPAAR